jgi:hypothetical protein
VMRHICGLAFRTTCKTGFIGNFAAHPSAVGLDR